MAVALEIPRDVVNGTMAAQGDRVADRLNWAQESPTSINGFGHELTWPLQILPQAPKKAVSDNPT